MKQLVLCNRQKARRINTPLLRRVLRSFLFQTLKIEGCELCLHLVDTIEMARINEAFLSHAGSTDVITFDYADNPPVGPLAESRAVHLHGEIFVCVDEAVRQAREFRTTWQAEIVRYSVHGILHLLGHDDKRPVARRRMKREENRLLTKLSAQFVFKKLDKAR